MIKCKRFVAVLLVLAMILSFSSFVFGAETDIDNHWAKEEIQYMMDKNIVSGYPDGNFKPDKQITRAEFVKIINYIFGYLEKDSILFTDVKEGDWFYEEVAKAVRAGYISGYEDGTMKPNNPITRQEVSKVMGMVFGLDESRKSADDFTDANQIGDWAKGYVGILKDKGYISGYPDGTFRPGNPITRAESVKIVTNASGIIINEKGEYSEDAVGNVLVNTSDVTLKDMKIPGDLYLVEGIGDGNVALDNVTVEGRTHIRGGGKDSITMKNSKIGQIFAQKAEGDVRLVLEGTIGIPSMILDGNGILVIKKGTKVDSIKIIGKWIIEIEEGARVGLIEVQAKGVEIKSEGTVDLIRPTDETKINDQLIEKDREVKIEDGEIKYIEEEEKPEDSKPTDSGPAGPSKPDSEDGEKPKDEIKTVSVSGEAVIGKTLVASPTPSGATVNYQWMISSAADGAYTNISGATSKTYKLANADENKWIKVKATGTGNYKGTVTSVPFGPIKAEAVKPISYASTAVKDFDVSVDYGTSESVAIDRLEKTVGVTGTKGETGTATISWTIASYDGNSAGTYTATGVLALPSGWTGTAVDVTATVIVETKVVEPISYASTAVKDFDVSVDYGTSESVAIDRLEKTVGVTGTKGETGTATISWTIASYDGNSAGTYTATGVLALPSGWTGTAVDVTATVIVETKVVEPISYASTAVKDFDIDVAYGTDESAARAALAKSVGVTGTKGEIGTATISWTIASYDGNSAGTYTATGVLALPSGWTGTAANVKAVVTVKEKIVTAPTYASTEDKNFDVSVAYGTGESAARAALAKSVGVTGTKGETGTATISWTIASYDGHSVGTYTATGVLSLPSGWTGTAANVTATVTVEHISYASTVTKNFDISVAHGTDEGTAIANLANTVGVTGTKGETDAAEISWTIASYDGNSEGTYTATGVLTLPAGWIGPAADVTATVTVEEPEGVILIAQGVLGLPTSIVRVKGYNNFTIYFDGKYLASSKEDGTVTIATEVLKSDWSRIKVEINNDGVKRPVKGIE